MDNRFLRQLTGEGIGPRVWAISRQIQTGRSKLRRG